MSKTIVITGVSSGLGKKMAEELSSSGYDVIGLCRNIEKIENEFKEKNIRIIKCDIRNNKSIISAFESIKNIDVLINNASKFISKNLKNMTHYEIEDILDTNLKGTILCTLESLKKMTKGRIINIGSVSGTHGIKNQSIYSSSKFGLIGFSESLSQELNDINITTICPGGINTPLWNSDNKYDGDVNDLLNTNDIIDTINYIINSNDNVVIKQITLFPKCEWH
jgi:short-subunit dehydrogenase